jgi:hypothetical protein
MDVETVDSKGHPLGWVARGVFSFLVDIVNDGMLRLRLRRGMGSGLW